MSHKSSEILINCCTIAYNLLHAENTMSLIRNSNNKISHKSFFIKFGVASQYKPKIQFKWFEFRCKQFNYQHHSKKRVIEKERESTVTTDGSKNNGRFTLYTLNDESAFPSERMILTVLVYYFNLTFVGPTAVSPVHSTILFCIIIQSNFHRNFSHYKKKLYVLIWPLPKNSNNNNKIIRFVWCNWSVDAISE